MYRQVSKLILYRNLGENSILKQLSEIFRRFENGHDQPEDLVTDIYCQVKALLDLGTTFGFDKNLWHNYLTFVLITNENSFSMTSEKVGKNEGTVNHFAKMILRCLWSSSAMISVRLRKLLGLIVSPPC